MKIPSKLKTTLSTFIKVAYITRMKSRLLNKYISKMKKDISSYYKGFSSPIATTFKITKKKEKTITK